jgi:2-polyprenyl-3-methyl-5-hydroxy-6-metoxy-1,4-benzoquinol methylase
MALRIGFFTSLGVNVGDEFIREGIRAVLDRLRKSYEPFYVHKLDRRSLTIPAEDERSLVPDKYRFCDLFIQSGAPVYWYLLKGASHSLNSQWHDWMWQERILGECKLNAPIFLNLGAGSCQPWGEDGRDFLSVPACAQFAISASERASLTTVRDPVAHGILKTLELPHEVLPCPAFLAGRRHQPRRPQGRHLALNLMPLGTHYDLSGDFNKDQWLKNCFQLVQNLRGFHPLVFIAHDSKERAFMNLFATGDERVIFSHSWRDYFDFYSSIRGVIANRVHGAVCAAGFGVPSLILGNDTRARIGEYIGIPALRSGSADPFEVVDTFDAMLSHYAKESERLHVLAEETLSTYAALMEPLLEKAAIQSSTFSNPSQAEAAKPCARLASVTELNTRPFMEWMEGVNAFSESYDLRVFTNWSKVWEYPWIWYNGLKEIELNRSTILDIGSEISPFPWLASIQGAKVTMVEVNTEWAGHWQELKDKLCTEIDWQILNSEKLPFKDETFDVVTSFSVVEHQANKQTAVNEIARVLKPGGVLAISFDICEPSMGMTFPEWNGKALTLQEFEELFWQHPAFYNLTPIEWNLEDIPAFLDWHMQSAPHHNYVTGAAILIKKRSI